MKKLGFIVFLGALIGCSQQNDSGTEKLQNTVSQLQNNVSQLSDRVTQLALVLTNEAARLEYAENVEWTNITVLFTNGAIYWNAQQNIASNVQVLRLEFNMLDSDYGSVSITPEAKGFSYLKTPYGVLLVSTENVDSYLDGYKIHLSVGNPMSASFHGFSLICSTYDSTTNFFLTYHSITNDMTDTLNAGSWNKVEFVLAPATMQEVRNASVSIELNQVSLHPPLQNGSAE